MSSNKNDIYLEKRILKKKSNPFIIFYTQTYKFNYLIKSLRFRMFLI